MRTKEKFLKLIDSKNPEGGLWTIVKKLYEDYENNLKYMLERV